ncbi:MAG: DUF11 domain-containing protein, partial [Caldilineaceae bacterium]|nr:DUF11 domain-containing protein [Caldilineaceae bacterium]
MALGKPTDLAAVAVGQTYQYKVNFYNAGQTTLTSVVVKDTLPGGVQFISAVPAQNSGPNPLTWNVGTLQPGQKFAALVTVKATSNGPLENCIEVTSAQLPAQTVCETIPAGPVVILNPQKSVTPTTVAPGGAVRYTVDVTNVGTATSGNPVVIRDVLPTGFTYAAAPAPTATVNGASVTPSVNAADPGNPVFTIPAGIAAGKTLVLEFSAQVSANQDAGTYCNRYTVSQNGVNLPTGLLACVNVGAAEIGDEVWRDWNGNGIRDPEDEGLPGVNLTLTPGAVADTTDANGTYLYDGLSAGTYTVNVTPPSGYTQTYDPDATVDNAHTVTVSEGQSYLLADFGYQPGGVGVIGDKVFDDKDGDGLFNNADVGIDNVTVTLFEDTNGDGEVDPVEDAQIGQTVSSGGGNYSFTGLAEGVDYIVRVDAADPDLASYFQAAYGFNTYATTTPPSQQSLNLSGSDLARDFGFESVAPVTVGDEVFIDNNNNGVFDGGDEPVAGVTVQIYGDANSNGEIDPGEPLLATATTDGAGIYSTSVAPGDYVARVRPNDPNLPGGISPSVGTIAFTLTTARTDIDFPYVRVLSKSVDKTSATANEILTYQIVPRYPGAELLSNVVVSDTIPTGTVYAGNDSPPATNEPSIDGAGTIVWTLGSNVAGTPGSTAGSIGSGTLTVNSSQDTWINND